MPLLILGSLSFLSGIKVRDDIFSGKQKSWTVKWVEEYPPPGKIKSNSFGEKVSGIVLGKKEISLMKPFGVLAKNNRDFWILDQGVGTLIHVSHNESTVPAVLKKQKTSYPSLAGLCAFGENRLLFTDSRLNKIFLFYTDRKKVKTLNDSLQLERPTGIAWSQPRKEIWVVETAAHRISVLDPSGKLLRWVGKRGNGPGEFNFPTFIWIDRDGNIYIVDSMNFRLQILDAAGKYITSFGKIGDASGYFARPKGVAVDSHGNIYVADALYNVVQIYNKKGDFLYYFGSQGHGKEQFWMPSGIYVDDRDFIYVADTYNKRVQIFQLTEEK